METAPPHFFAAYPDRNVDVIVAVFQQVYFEMVFRLRFAIGVVAVARLEFLAQALVRLRRPLLDLTLEIPPQVLAFHFGIFLQIVAGSAAIFAY